AQKVGRLTPNGDMVEFALPTPGPPMGLAAGPDGNVWVTLAAAHTVCRISPDGRAMAWRFTDTVMPGLIVAGPDGNLWFTEPTGKIGRLTTAGFLTEFPSGWPREVAGVDR
ncbi:MAG: virginiamycin B lyase family protein, partial [Candidatus Binataceae bacterium]